MNEQELLEQIKELRSLIREKKDELFKSDYQAIKFAEGVMSAEEFAPIKAKRQEARAAINEAEIELASLKEQRRALKAK